MGRVERACVILLSVALVAGLQPGLASGQPWRAPRTSWGHPDLQGVWSTATITPLERPPELAGKPFFSRKRSRNTNGRRSSIQSRSTRRHPHGRSDGEIVRLPRATRPITDSKACLKGGRAQADRKAIAEASAKKTPQ